jgi:hypothetical protein
MGKGMRVKDPEDIQQPQNHRDDNNAVQDRVDAGLHGNKPIHTPQQNSNDNQRNDNLGQRHATLLLLAPYADRPRKESDQPGS